MSIRQIEYVLAIVKHGGLRRAASHLFVSEATVSQQIAKLEKELGIALFQHARTRWAALELTDEGRRILPALQRVIESHNYVFQRATALKIQRARQENVG